MAIPTMKEWERRSRWQATALTWLTKSVWLTVAQAKSENKDVRLVVGYDAARMMHGVLDAAATLVSSLNDDELDEAINHAKQVVKRLRAHHLAGKLANVQGRTDAEAASFLAQAAKLSEEV